MPKTGILLDRLAGLPLESVSCYLCGSDEGKILVDDPPFRVLRCARCGLGYTSPRIRGDHLSRLYDDGYFESERAEAYGYSGYQADLASYLKTFRAKARWVQAMEPSGSLLEIGSAGGAFLKAMEELGYEVAGFELSPAMVRFGREQLGLRGLVQGGFDELDAVPAPVDIVALFDVIEHVPEPVAALEKVKAVLRPGGLLVLQTQDLDSLARRVLRSRWPHFKQMEHVYHFNPSTVAKVLERAGFSGVSITRKRAGKHVAFVDIADRAHRVVGIPSVLLAPIRALGRRSIYLNFGDEMLVSARKPASP